MRWLPLVAAACAGPAATTPVDDPAPVTTTIGSTGTTAVTGDTAALPTTPGLADDCDPVVRVPGLGGVADPLLEADPHDGVYGAEPTPYAVRYSWPGTDPSVSGAFLWRTDLDTLASMIELTPAGGVSFTVEGASFLFGGVEQYRMHEVKLCQQLSPSTTYRYRVGGPGHWSREYQFTTPGPPGSFDTFRVAVAGDSRGSYDQWATLLAAADAFDPDFYLFTGDAVNTGSVQPEWDAWYLATGERFARRALVPVHGNHEGLAINWFAQVSLPGNEQWYRIRYGTLDLAVLNDSSVPTDDWTLQATWLGDELGASDATWKIAAHHQSVYATCTRHGSNTELRSLWTPVYDATGVDVVFQGHNHIYERTVPILADAPAAEGPGVTYVVTGGAGAPLYPNVLADWFSSVANPVEHFLIVDFGPTGARAVARDLAGNVIDEFDLLAD